MGILTERQQTRLYLLLPLALSLAGALLCCWPLFALASINVFVLTGLLPMCAERESVWIFLTALPASGPANVFLIRRLASFWLFTGFAEGLLERVLWSTFAFLTLLSIEELALLLLSRVIWPEQRGDEILQKWIEEDSKKGGKRK